MEANNELSITRTQYHMEKDNIAAAQVQDAFEIAREYYWTGWSDYISYWSVRKILEKPEDHKEGSVRGFFRLDRRFTEEAAIAKEVGAPAEGIGGEAGIWQYQFNVDELDKDEARDLISEALKEAADEHLDSLQKMHHQVKGKIFFRFENRHKNSNLQEWLQALSQYRNKTTGEGIKDWGVYMDEKGEIKTRESYNPEDIFEIAVQRSGNVNADYKEIIERGLVGKVVLIEDEKGKIKKIEVCFPHATNDEDHGRKVLRKILEKVKPVESRKTDTEILRRVAINDVDGEKFFMLDIHSKYEVSPEEDVLIKKAQSVFEPRMNMSVFMAQSWLLINNERSAYICISPDKPRVPDGSVAAGLQFAMLPRAAKGGLFSQFVKGYGVVYKNPLREMSALYMTPGFEQRLGRVNTFMQKEIERSRRSLPTLAILDSYVPQISKKIFRTVFRRQERLFSKGSFQISSVDYRNEIFDNVTFVTALNISTEAAMAIGKYKDKSVVDVRLRTDREYLREAKRRLGIMGMTLVKDNIDVATKQIVKEKVANYRKGVVLLSAMLAIEDIRKKGEDTESKIAEIEELATKALEKIETEGGLK
jgi:hypothetical protein